MSAIAIVTDSNSGITPAQAKEFGVYVLPMPFMINGETFFEEISLTGKEFYEYMEKGADIITSQPSPDSVMKLWDGLLEEYDEVVSYALDLGIGHGFLQEGQAADESFIPEFE